MFNLGMPELIVIFVVALLVFGPKKLPELGKSLGRAMHEFKRSSNEFKESLESEVGTAEIREQLLREQKDIQESLIGKQAEPSTAAPAEAKAETPVTAKTNAG
ncbi:MAG: TatA/E family twin arginine-targeting protein translocase [Nitrospirae bacterium]|nr:TatA/E family twin arginine-targeting protein translocase [Nitrospirota bacterium]MBI5696324.1 TatA/E family twin arginine-targeting protein translocase [Nitrospirota bacterium]